MDFLETVSFHASALGSSFAESVHDVASGVVQLVAEDAPAATADYYQGVSENYGSLLAGISAPVVYLMHITLIPTGEAIGTGAAMVVYAKDGEEAAMGATSLFAGLCSAIIMVAPFASSIPSGTVYTQILQALKEAHRHAQMTKYLH